MKMINEGCVMGITREIAAPRELVWKAWTEADHLANWFGPTGFSITTSEIDVRPGGTWRFVMHGPDGTDYPNVVVYTTVDPPAMLAYNHGDGETDFQFSVVVTFKDLGAKTEMTMTATFRSEAERISVAEEVGAVEGMKQTTGRLAEYAKNLNR